MNSEKMYAAFGSRFGEPKQMITLYGEIFFTTKGMIEYMIKKMKSKHPNAEFSIQEVMYK